MSTPSDKEKTVRVLQAFSAELDTYEEQFNLLQSMGLILRQDVLDCGKLALDNNKTDWGSRAFTHAVFAMIEGGVFRLKQMALKLSEHGKGNFSRAELVILEETSYDLNDKGQTQTQVKFVPLTRNIKFAFIACARAWGVQYELRVDDSGFDSFQAALKIRNRITHPKRLEDLNLSEKEVGQVEKAARWFLEHHSAIIKLLVIRLQKLSDAFDATQKNTPPA
jgi:hypothetical protein